MTFTEITNALVDELAPLRFGSPVARVYNPLEYARATYDEYCARYGGTPKEVVLIGMNPGPFGMAQTGVPFGDVTMVRDWLDIAGAVERPRREHPKRPVLGFSCPRGEVSGTRLWGWARERFGTPDRFFRRFFVANYCPLLFMEESGRNRTPDRLPPTEREPLFAACDRALRHTVQLLRPDRVVGIGKFAHDRAARALDGTGVALGRVAHPSPANPAANRGWVPLVEAELEQLGVEL